MNKLTFVWLVIALVACGDDDDGGSDDAGGARDSGPLDLIDAVPGPVDASPVDASPDGPLSERACAALVVEWRNLVSALPHECQEDSDCTAIGFGRDDTCDCSLALDCSETSAAAGYHGSAAEQLEEEYFVQCRENGTYICDCAPPDLYVREQPLLGQRAKLSRSARGCGGRRGDRCRRRAVDANSRHRCRTPGVGAPTWSTIAAC